MDRRARLRPRSGRPGLRPHFAAAHRLPHEPRRQAETAFLHRRAARTHQVPAPRRRRHLHRRRLPAPRLALAHGAPRPLHPRRARFRRRPHLRSRLESRSRSPGLGRSRLPVRAPAPFKRTENEPPGTIRRIQGNGRQSRHQRPYPPPAAPDAPPQNAGRHQARCCRHHQPHSIRHRARVPPRYARARRRRQGAQPIRRPDQGNRPLGEHSHGREPAARSPPLPHRRGRTKRSRETLSRHCRNPGRRLSRASPRPGRRRNRTRRPPLMPASAVTTAAPTRNPFVEWIVPIAAVSLVFVMLVPLPAFALDLLLAASFAASVLVLLSALQILRPAQFSVFPSLLLLLTLFRLSLNLASSRRILLHGNEGAGAAGRVIESFGQFVVGGNYVVGFVLFIALIAIQYIVVSHGAVRTAEVTARFTLDALPGKQMAIDADLNAGLIDEHQARARREQTAREAEFYGAMDGAARFNQRDSIATILITGINILAGFLIGVFQLDIPFREALKTYTVLTVGDGLVTMIPSLLVSMAGGMVVTRASSNATLSADLGTQLLSRRRSLQIAAGVMVALACIPGLPKFSFLAIAGVVALLAARLPKPAKDKDGKVIEVAEPGALPAAEKDKKAAKSDSIEDLLKLDELSLEVGYSLVNLVDVQQGGQLLARVKALRSSLAVQLGFIVPPIHITDNVRLKPREYVISMRGVEIARWEMLEDKVLAISSELTPPALAGTPTREPAFGVAALWIAPALESQALTSGYAVVDQTSVLSTHLAEIIRQHAYELLTRQETKRLLDRLSESHPKLVEELVPKILSLGEVQKVLQQLLREQVSVRDLSTILETLLDASAANKNPVLLVEAARQSLARALVRPLLSDDGGLRVLTLDHNIEEELSRAFSAQAPPATSTGLQPSFVRRILDGLRALAGDQVAQAAPILLCSTPARFHLRRLLEPFLPKVVVLSPLEIPPMVSVQSLGTVR